MIAASAVSSNASATTPASYDYTLGTIEGSTIGDLLSASNGVVALTSNATVLTASTSAQCGSGLQLVDMVGYGSSSVTDPNTTATPATCYQGKGGAYYDGSVTYGYKMGLTRKNACINTGDNSSDWANTPIAYLNLRFDGDGLSGRHAAQRRGCGHAKHSFCGRADYCHRRRDSGYES